MEAHHRPRAELRQMRCLVGLCLFLSLLLSLPVLYLLKHRAGQNLDGEVPTGKMPEAQRLGTHDRNCSDCTSRKKARAHLAVAHEQSKCTSGSFPILYWRNDRSDEGDTITYSDGYLTVPEKGDYFVYAQVTFLCPDGRCEGMKNCMPNQTDKKTIITQIISKISPYYGSMPKWQLMTSTSIGEKEMWKKTLYLGGILKLREYDKLMVNVSNPMLVDITSPTMTFFGAFLV